MDVSTPGHTTPTPAIRRCLWLTPDLDLWLMRFCRAQKISRSYAFRQAIFDMLSKHYPDGKPVGDAQTIIENRWNESLVKILPLEATGAWKYGIKDQRTGKRQHRATRRYYASSKSTSTTGS